MGENGRTPGAWETGAGGPVEGRGHGRGGRRSRQGDSGCVAVLLMPGLLHHLREWCWKVVHLGCLQTAAPPAPRVQCCDPTSSPRMPELIAPPETGLARTSTLKSGGAGGGPVATTTVPNIGRGPLSTIPGGAIVWASTDSDSLQFDSVGIVFISFASPSDLRKLGTDAPGGSGRRLVDRRPQAQPQPPPRITAGPAAQGRKHGRKRVVGGA